VTNIIDAFGKDFVQGRGAFAGRWLRQGTGKQKPQRNIRLNFFQKLETPEYLERACTTYLDAARNAFPHLKQADVATVVATLLLVCSAGRRGDAGQETDNALGVEATIQSGQANPHP